MKPAGVAPEIVPTPCESKLSHPMTQALAQAGHPAPGSSHTRNISLHCQILQLPGGDSGLRDLLPVTLHSGLLHLKQMEQSSLMVWLLRQGVLKGCCLWKTIGNVQV